MKAASPTKKAVSSVKSGRENKNYAAGVLNDPLPRKSVDEIEKVNRVSKAPGSVSR